MPGLDLKPRRLNGASAGEARVVCKVLVWLVNVHIHLASVRSNLPPDACGHLSGSPGRSVVLWEGAGLSGHPSSLGSPSKLPSFGPQHSMVIPSRLDAVRGGGGGGKTLSRLLCHSLPSRDWSRKDRLSLRGILFFEDHLMAGIASYASSTPKGWQGSLEMARGLPLLPSQSGQGKSKPPEASRCN